MAHALLRAASTLVSPPANTIQTNPMTTLAIIIGNRGFFPDALAKEGRLEILRVLEQQGYNTICLAPDQTKHGAVETLSDARKCADLFKQHRDQIDGVLV